MVDASKGFIKDGNKNRLREQDTHRIVDTFTRQVDTPRYARMVPLAEIADPRNDFNLNLPRYIDSSEPEDLQDIDAHLRGGIPERDLDAFAADWQVLPGVRQALFESAGRPGYARLKLLQAEVKATVLGHPEFATFTGKVNTLFDKWRQAITPLLTGFGEGKHPKALIEAVSETLLATFQAAPLLDPYDVYQHLMDYWAEVMQDDTYLIAADGWVQAAQPREIVKQPNKDNKLVWPEPHDYLQGKRRFKSDLIPKPLLVARYFAPQQEAIDAAQAEIEALLAQITELEEEHSGEDAVLSGFDSITAAAVNDRVREIDGADDAEELAILQQWLRLTDTVAARKKKLRAAESALDAMALQQFPQLKDAEVKHLVVEDKWFIRLHADMQGEIDRISQTLTSRIRELAERYATPLPQLTDEVEALARRVDGHLKRMGFAWN
jgi:type I restriction enzyme M protein